MSVTYVAGFDSPVANNGSLNVQTVDGAASITIEFVKIPSGGDLLLETNGGAADPDTQVIINGVTYDFIFIETGTFPGLNTPDPGDKVPTALEGQRVAIIRIENYDSNGPQQFFFTPDRPETTAAEIEAVGDKGVKLDPRNQDPPFEPVCFLSGTVIETPTGPVRVNDLKAGDLVCTADHGPQPLIWVTSSRHVWPGSDERHKPVLISAGALGKNTPSHDLIVSPQHHIAFRGAVCRELFDEETILAPAKGLTGLRGIRVMAGKTEAEYFHLMLSEHAVLIAQGAEAESFYPGPTALRMMNKAQRDELYDILPNLHAGSEAGYGPPAFKKITCRQADMLVRKLRKRPDQERTLVAVIKSLENA